jgi:hypothetical protein
MMRQKDRPWEALGMSRATWYRLGKPAEKPAPRITVKQAADMDGVSLRMMERARFVHRYGPDLLEHVLAGSMSMDAAIRLIHQRQGRHSG